MEKVGEKYEAKSMDRSVVHSPPLKTATENIPEELNFT